MASQNAMVSIYDSPSEAYAALRRLQRSGFERNKLSVAAREQSEEAQVAAYYLSRDRVRCWGAQAAVWDLVWGMLSGWALFALPGIGRVWVAGPLSGWILACLENAPILNGLGGFGAGLHSVGIDRSSIPVYEAALRTNRCLVLAHGTREEVDKARLTLASDRLRHDRRPAP
jgi:hypothetical protein